MKLKRKSHVKKIKVAHVCIINSWLYHIFAQKRSMDKETVTRARTFDTTFLGRKEMEVIVCKLSALAMSGCFLFLAADNPGQPQQWSQILATTILYSNKIMIDLVQQPKFCLFVDNTLVCGLAWLQVSKHAPSYVMSYPKSKLHKFCN